MTTLCIEGGRVLRPDVTVERADVLVDREAGEILEVAPDLAGDETLDASDGLVIPGLVNVHGHAAMTLLRSNADDVPLGPWLREAVWPVEAELTAEDVRAGAELGLLEHVTNGTTAFGDMYFYMDEYVEVVEELGLRALLGYGCITVGEDDEAAREELETTVEFAREYDGAADGRVKTAVMPHSLTTVDEWVLGEAADAADEHDLPLHIHANENEGEVDPILDEQGVRPLQYADDLGLLGADTFLAHCVHVDESEIDLLAATNTGVAHCPASNTKLNSGIAPVQAMLDAGVTVGVGTDGPASNNDLDAFDEVRDAAMVGKLGADDAAAVDAESVVRMATAGGADLLGFDAGRVEAGRAADLAVVDLEAPHLTPEHDLVSLLAYAVRGSDVRHTVCDGQVLMADREVTVLDEAAVRARAQQHAEALLDRAG
jgi:5-methylthioadenosine/S-adenosylhomocysteine deaminase